MRFSIVGDFNEVVCIAFGMGKYLEKLNSVATVDLLGYLEINEWNGHESLQFRVIDMNL